MQGLYIKTYGCQMNVYDSLIMEKVINNLGFQKVDELESANIVILNTCHIREKASEKLYSELGNIRKIKERKELLIVIAGCVAQAEGTEIFKRAPFVDIIVGPQSIHTLPELITKIQRTKGKLINLDFPLISKFDTLKNTKYYENQGISAFLSIQEGCDKFCTFCVVPYTRGAEYSRPVDAIIKEALSLVKNGTKEITLLGQNVNAYHGNYDGKTFNLGQLIKQLALIEGLERIRYTTSHPRDMHDELYEVHQNEKKLMPFLHLPVQSGSDKILRSMNRKHTAGEYIEIIEKLTRYKSNIAFSSDFIVGFPGETEKDFEDTLQLINKVNFVQAYSFKYSPRPGTPGAEYKNQVSEDIKTERLSRLQKLISIKQLEYNQSMTTKKLPVLFEDKKGKFNNQLIGKTPYMQSVYVTSQDLENYYNRIINVTITGGYQNSLSGIIE